MSRIGFIFILFLLYLPTRAEAHSRTVSRSDWTQDGTDWLVRVRLPVMELDRAFGLNQWDKQTAERVALDSFVPITQGCKAEEIKSHVTAKDVVVSWRWICEQNTEALRISPFFDTAPAHLHYTNINIGSQRLERIVTGASQEIQLNTLAPTGILGSARSGIGHLIIGWDHILFLIGLAFLAVSWRSLLGIVTAFTLAHAVGLTIVAVGWVRPQTQSVESLIGLSIGIIALEAIMAGVDAPTRKRGRWVISGGLWFAALAAAFDLLSIEPWAPVGFAMIQLGLGRLPVSNSIIAWVHACGFGLIHGLGIAGALSGWGESGEISVRTILGFNLGVEAGQILVASGVFLLMSLSTQRLVSSESPVGLRDFVSTLLVAIGVYWFIGRAVGLT